MNIFSCLYFPIIHMFAHLFLIFFKTIHDTNIEFNLQKQIIFVSVIKLNVREHYVKLQSHLCALHIYICIV